MKLFNALKLKRISDLETIEEKSFWIVSPMVILVGLISLTTSGSYGSALPIVAAAVFCLIIPAGLMIFVSKKKNYHSAYPLLCISTGAVAVPITFVFGGGFLSCMPLFCVVTTGITVLCYSAKFRYISFASCFVGNTIAFLYVYFHGSPFPIIGSETLAADRAAVWPVYNDILFGYYVASFVLFFSVHFVVNDIRRYKINQDALQQYFDIEKKKEILKQAMSEGTAKRAEHKKAVILFADISNFTPITEKMSSDLISEYLSEFFTAAGKYIHETGGIIDKYIGDCVMAYWLEGEDATACVLSAVHSMVRLKEDLYARNETIYEKYGTELNFSVGMAYGDVIFGDIGSDKMHDFTVIGDAVNTASRIQDYAVSGEMLISDAAAEMVQKNVLLEKVEADHFFKGKNRSIDLYRIQGLTEQTQEIALSSRVPYGYTLQICGCRGSFPVSGLRFSEYGGETSCYVVRKGDYAVIVDCGTGLKNAMQVIEGCTHIDILLTHVHYDHILGFLMSKFPKSAKVRVFGRFSQWNSETNTLEAFMEHPYWPVEIIETEKIDVELEKEILLGEEMRATFYRSDHPDNACVITLLCRDKKVVFLADCENAHLLNPDISRGSELLFFDGMFDDNDTVDHKGWGHGTWQESIRFLDGKNIKKLVITHHNPELGDHSLMLREMEARKRAANVSFAKSGDRFTL